MSRAGEPIARATPPGALDTVITIGTLEREEDGAAMRELMDWMGHSSTRAALIYLHSSDDRQRATADGLSQLAQRELRAQESGLARHGHLDELRERAASGDGYTRRWLAEALRWLYLPHGQ